MAVAIPFVMMAFSAIGSMNEQNAQEAMLNNQAKALDDKAEDLKFEGAVQESAIRDQSDFIEGQIISSAAGSGVQANTGSVLDVINQNAFNIEMDAITTRENYFNQAKTLEQEAKAARAGIPSGLSTLTQTAGAAASGYASGLNMAGSFA